MRLTSLFLLVFSGTSQAIARPVGVEATIAVGDVVAIGGVGAPPAVVHRRRPLAFPPAQLEVRIGARAYPRGVSASISVGAVRAVAGARTLLAGFAVRSATAPVRPTAGARAGVAGLSATGSTFAARAFGAARVKPYGLRAVAGLGVPVGHPTEDEAAFMRFEAELADEDALLLAGAFD